MDLVQKIIERAKSNKQRIVLPEATEERTLRAADRVLADDVADLILIGNPDEVHKLAKEWGLTNIDKATLIDPENNPKAEEYATLLAEHMRLFNEEMYRRARERREKLKCSKCGHHTLMLDDSVVLTSNPPMYAYRCVNCKSVEYKSERIDD